MTVTFRLPLLLAGALIATGIPLDAAHSQSWTDSGARIDEPPRIRVPAPVGAGAFRPEPFVAPLPAVRLREPAERGRPDIAGRLGAGQTEDELVRTTLLNRFGGLGFAELGRLRREGDLYAAEVRTVDGEWIVVTIDPRSGEIVSRQ